MLNNKRITSPEPTSQYQMNNSNPNHSGKSKNITTTARLSYDTLNKANAIITMRDFTSFDDLIRDLLQDYENRVLADDEKRELEIMIKAYELQQKPKAKKKRK